MSRIIPTAEPFLFPGSRTGCLLIHGFTGAPKEMRWMGEFLAKQGYSVAGIRLAGHATRPEDMIRSRWTDWVASVEDGYHLLKGLADRIYLVGLSMGGVLALLMSTRLEVKGVVAMSTPYLLRDHLLIPFIRGLSPFMSYLPKTKAPPGAGWFDQEAWKDHVSYPQNPVRSIAELNSLLSEMRASLPQVRVPVLLVHSRQDGYVLPENLEHISEHLINVPSRTVLYVENSGHVVTRDAARLQVFEAAAKFIQDVENTSR